MLFNTDCCVPIYAQVHRPYLYTKIDPQTRDSAYQILTSISADPASLLSPPVSDAIPSNSTRSELSPVTNPLACSAPASRYPTLYLTLNPKLPLQASLLLNLHFVAILSKQYVGHYIQEDFQQLRHHLCAPPVCAACVRHHLRAPPLARTMGTACAYMQHSVPEPRPEASALPSDSTV